MTEFRAILYLPGPGEDFSATGSMWSMPVYTEIPDDLADKIRNGKALPVITFEERR